MFSYPIYSYIFPYYTHQFSNMFIKIHCSEHPLFPYIPSSALLWGSSNCLPGCNPHYSKSDLQKKRPWPTNCPCPLSPPSNSLLPNAWPGQCWGQNSEVFQGKGKLTYSSCTICTWMAHQGLLYQLLGICHKGWGYLVARAFSEIRTQIQEAEWHADARAS